ncbi:hypothetical protein BD311DRAFT_776380 [Dichomitus squalens]|uniref:Uncharacterized protein n=1 Tax=Dichomitus squalens TaxID=114155 RepID=A0A4Q9MUY1_9APHY|nr:hypothetical protein BD311DRAFT_776380 [Dichomitus squalens]
MHSPTTPRALSSSKFLVSPWRPWSISSGWTSIRRRLCGLLNKVAPANVDRIADHFATLAINLGRSGDVESVEAGGQMIVHRCTVDPTRIGLYAKLVQRAADALEGESLAWRSVDPYHLDDPATSLPAAVQSTLLANLVSALRGGCEQDACALAAFAGELLVFGILSPEDVKDVVVSVFQQVSGNSAIYCVLLCRMLRRIVNSTEASHLINSLSLVSRIEAVLEEDTISLMVRYMMTSLLDHCMYPRPQDAFADIPRSEIYGLHDDRVEDGPISAHSLQVVEAVERHALTETFSQRARIFFKARSVAGVAQFFHTLRADERHMFIATFISAAMGSGDEADAAAVASLLSAPSIRRVLAEDPCSIKIFEAETITLEDTVLDYPSAYGAMATMLHGASIPIIAVEDLASRIVIRDNYARDRLLGEFNRLNIGGDGASDRYALGAEYASGEEESASEYAYAY